jgi:hypothetical protein
LVLVLDDWLSIMSWLEGPFLAGPGFKVE